MLDDITSLRKKPGTEFLTLYGTGEYNLARHANGLDVGRNKARVILMSWWQSHLYHQFF